jgi:hypothetical protein
MKNIAEKMSPLVRWMVGGGALLVGSALTIAACSSDDTTTPDAAAGAGGTTAGAGGAAAGAGGSTAGAGGSAAGAGGSTAGAGGAAAGAGGAAAGAGGAAAGAGGAAAGAGGAKACGSLNPPSAKATCTSCLASKCCDEQLACSATPNCLACNQAANPGTGGAAGAGGAAPTNCSADPELSALTTCLLNSCAADCELQLTVIDVDAPPVAPSKGACVDETNPLNLCNPVKHTGCTKDTTPDDVNKMKTPMPDVPSDLASGYACDGNYGQDGKPSLGLICFGPPNTQTLDQPCGDDINKYCADGFRCMQTVSGKKCAAYCCNDGDCSAKGKCDTAAISDISGGTFGICVVK